MMNQHRPKLRDPRPPQFRTVDETTDEDNCIHDLQVACAMYQQDEDRKRGRKPRKPPKKGERLSYPELDTLIRDACYSGAGADDLRRADDIGASIQSRAADRGNVVAIGPKLGCEILAAIGWLMSD